MVETRRLLAVAVLVVLAGCSGSTSSTTTGTATAAPVPTDAPSPAPAPAVTSRGVQSPVALVMAHERALRGTSVTVRVEESRRYANGSLRWRRTTTQRIDDGGPTTRSHYASEFRGATPSGGLPSGFVRFPNTARVERYTVGDGAYHRYRLRSGGVWYVGGTVSNVRPLDPGLLLLFRAVDLRLVDHGTDEEQARYRLAGTEVVSRATLERALGVGPVADLRNVSLEATVDADGVVREYDLTYTLVGPDGVRLHGREWVRFTDLGETTVDRPDWHAAAVNATGAWGEEDANASRRSG